MVKLTKSSVICSWNMKMPVVGLGTWQSSNDDAGKTAVTAALDAGYRHIDTAYMYSNEKVVGEAVNNYIKSGKLKREDVFIVTKLPMVGNRAEHVEEFLKKSLANLQMDYVDLYLVHFPVGFKYDGDNIRPVDAEGKVIVDMNTDHVSLWKAMEKQVDAGRAKAIGLSNFNIDQMKRILKEARIPPANLQVELHVYFQQKELLEFCKSHNITVCAYGPLGSPGLKDALSRMNPKALEHVKYPMEDPCVVKLAEKHKKTPAHILLKYLLELGVAVIPKSMNPDRIKSNIDIFDFEFSKDDIEQLKKLDQGKDGRMFKSDIMRGMENHPERPY